MFEVYLAGTISGLSYDEAQTLRREITSKLNEIDIKVRNPLRGKAVMLKDKKSITIDTVKESSALGVANSLTMQEIVLRDLHDLERVNVLVVLTGDVPSWGTAGEVFYTVWITKKPILVIAKNHNKLSWLSYFATKVVSDADEAVEVLKVWSRYWDNGEGVYDFV